MERICIGSSEIASLVVRSVCKLEELRMGEDGIYFVYLTKNANDYKGEKELVFTCENWLKIYDDNGLVYNNDKCKYYNIYRCWDEYDPTLLIECLETR